jgi:DNA-binding transcriptional MocR family regulator
LRYDPHPAGSLAAREAVCRYYAEAGHTVEPDRVLLTASTSEAYAYVFKLLADPGDECWRRGHRIRCSSFSRPWNRCAWFPIR